MLDIVLCSLSSRLLPKNIKIKIYKTIILRVVCMGVKLDLSLYGKNTDWWCLKTVLWNFVSCTLHQILLGD